MKSVYIHIPFCNNICSYCDFTKLYYNKKYINDYLNALEKEILLNYKGEIIETIYIGGGTPDSLDTNELQRLFKIIKIFKTKDLEFTIECNVENINKEKLKFFKENNINRLSIGVQTFNESNIAFLNRKHNKKQAIDNILSAKKYFDNINIDLIYALPKQKVEDLIEDINIFKSLNIPHISTYSLIIEPHTKLYIDKTEYVKEEIDALMYETICNELNNYNHYEISNFCLENFHSKHNSNYWDNGNYYGFGLGASGYIDNYRYTNTKNIEEYIKENYIYEKTLLNIKDKMEEEMFLGLRKISGVNLASFYKKYKKNINEVFNIEKLIEEKKLILENDHLRINKNYLYISNDILINFIGDQYE